MASIADRTACRRVRVSLPRTCYQTFATDFLHSRPTFQGRPLQLRIYLNGATPPNGKEGTFWHLMSEGIDEETRTPDPARCERMGWIRAMLDHLRSNGPDVRVWSQSRHGKTNYGVALSTFEYLVFLGERPNGRTTYTLPLTAYCVESEQRRTKYRTEWEREGIYPPKPAPPPFGGGT